MGVYQKLAVLQLKVQKRHYESFEGLLKSIKQMLKANKCVITLSEEVVDGYIKATATLIDTESGEQVSAIGCCLKLHDFALTHARINALEGLLFTTNLIGLNKASAKQIEQIREIAKEQGKALDEEKIKDWNTKQANEFINRFKGGK